MIPDGTLSTLDTNARSFDHQIRASMLSPAIQLHNDHKMRILLPNFDYTISAIYSFLYFCRLRHQGIHEYPQISV